MNVASTKRLVWVVVLASVLLPCMSIAEAGGELNLYRDAAKQGDMEAQYQMGLIYYEGRGVPQDFEKAAKWFQRAGKKGHAQAQYYRGLMLFEGKGVEKNPDKAKKWMTLAATNGNPDARKYLGLPATSDSPKSAKKQSEPGEREAEALEIAQTANGKQTDEVPEYCGYPIEKLRWWFANSANNIVPEIKDDTINYLWYRNGQRQASVLDSINLADITDAIKNACAGQQLLDRVALVVTEEHEHRHVYAARCFLPPEQWQAINDLAADTTHRNPRGNGYPYSAFTLCKDPQAVNIYGAEGKCPKLVSLIREASNGATQACINYFQNTLYSGLISAIVEKDHRLIAQKDAAEKARIEKEKAAAELHSAIEQRNTLLATVELPSKEKVVWGQDVRGNGTGGASNTEEWLNEVNLAYQEKRKSALVADDFVTPEKGEFEKTEAYRKRISELQRSHEDAVLAAAAEQERARADTLSAAIGEVSGKPRILSINYDADTETFRGSVGVDKLVLEFSLHTPISTAKEKKSELLKARPWIVFRFDGQKLRPISAVLQTAKSAYRFDLNDINLDFIFDESSLKNYLAAAEQKKAEAKRIADKERREHAKAYPYFAFFTCEIQGSMLPLLTCLKTDGRVSVTTQTGTRTYSMADVMGLNDLKVDLTESFTVYGESGSSAPSFGQMKIEVFKQVPTTLLKTVSVTGPSDFASISN